MNALCWRRELGGDFGEVVRLLGAGEGVVSLEETDLESLEVSPAGHAAVRVMLDDWRRLLALGAQPELNLIHCYQRDEGSGPVPTDVFSYHVDSATVAAETWLCTYHGRASQGLLNEEAVRRVDVG